MTYSHNGSGSRSASGDSGVTGWQGWHSISAPSAKASLSSREVDEMTLLESSLCVRRWENKSLRQDLMSSFTSM